MKTTRISKSAVMTRAWSIYKNNRNLFPTFSLALTRAWEVEKTNLAREIEKRSYNARQPRKRVRTDYLNPMIQQSLINYYANSAYQGD